MKEGGRKREQEERREKNGFQSVTNPLLLANYFNERNEYKTDDGQGERKREKKEG